MRVSSGAKRIDLTVLLLIVACVMLNPVFAGDPQTILVFRRRIGGCKLR